MTASDTGKLISKSDIPVGVGQPSAEEARKWIDSQIPYQNWAGHSEELDGDVAAFAEGIRTDFLNRVSEVHQHWAVNWTTANGNPISQEHPDDVHVPETAKMLHTKAVRIEEALFDPDPMIEVEGEHDTIEAPIADILAAYVRGLMEQARFRDYVMPSIKDGQLCQISAVKVIWDRVLEDVIDRQIELRHYKDGTPYYHTERRQRRALTFDGPVIELVDPWRLIIDLDAGQVKDCSYIGDISEQYVHILEQKAEVGLFNKKAVKKVREMADQTATRTGGKGDVSDLSERYRLARQITLPYDEHLYTGVRAGARRVRVLELWAWFDFGDGYSGVTDPSGRKLTGYHRVVITIAQGQVLQFRLNPFDRKFPPYGISRMNRTGHEMFTRGPFDNTVIVNAQYDRVQSNILRHLDLTVAPRIVTGHDADFPGDNIGGTLPGAILRGLGADWKVLDIPDLPQSVAYFHDYFRRECEETSGSIRIYEGQVEAGVTATAAERGYQEANRNIRGDIRSTAEQWRQVGLIMYWMAGQFSTQRQRFQVVGKAADVLGKFLEVTPDMLQEDINVRFVGLDSLHTLGRRTSGMVQWQNGWGPMAPLLPGVNWEALAKMQWEEMVGRQHVREVFPNTDEPGWNHWPQDKENVLLRQGKSVSVSRKDNHREHMMKMEQDGTLDLAMKEDTPDYVIDAILEHYQAHEEAEKQAEMERQMEMEAAQRRGDLAAPMQGGAGQGAPAAPGGMEAQATTPGPAQERTVARTGRSGAGVSQQQRTEGEG